MDHTLRNKVNTSELLQALKEVRTQAKNEAREALAMGTQFKGASKNSAIRIKNT